MAKMKNNTDIPQHAIAALARCLLPEIEKYYESEAGKREYEEWKKKQAAENSDKTK